MWRVQGESIAIEKDASVDEASESRKAGQLVRINSSGKALVANGAGFYMPLMRAFDATKKDPVEVQISGAAKLYVETASGIIPGSPLAAGSTGLGVKLATDTDQVIGVAVVAPRGDGDYVPAILSYGAAADSAFY